MGWVFFYIIDFFLKNNVLNPIMRYQLVHFYASSAEK